jgi:hypothetical protein
MKKKCARISRMALSLAAIAGAGFGSADQYFGNLSAIRWLVDTKLLSAPWTLLPFSCDHRHMTTVGRHVPVST